MIYPRLFEEYEERGDLDVSGISFTDLRDKIIGVGKRLPIQVDDSDYLWRVDKNRAEDPITWEYVMGLNSSKYKNFILDYIASEFEDLDPKEEIKSIKKAQKKDSSFKPEELDLYHGDFWDWRLDQWEHPEKDDSESSSSATKVIDLTDPQWDSLNEFFTDRGKISELTDFVLNVPQTGDTLKTLEDYLSTLQDIIEGKDRVKIDKGSKDVYLPADKYEEWKDDMVKHIGAYESPEDLNPIYKDEILKKGTFLNYVFNLEPKGVGRGEALLVYTIPDSRFAGGSEDYDVVVEGQAIYEVKDYSSKDSGNEIRLGTHGKVSQFDFYHEIKKSIDVAKKILDNVGEAELRKIVGKYNYQYWKNMTTNDNYNSNFKALPSAVSAGELPPPRLKLLIDWHFLNHMLIEEGPEDAEKYTMAVLRGTKMRPMTVKIDPVQADEISGGKSVTISELEDQERVFNELRNLKYIRDPHQLVEDLENAPKSYFDKVLEKFGSDAPDFFFLIFRPDEIKVLRDKDFNLATITQSGIKITEETKRELSAIQSAFKDYKKLRSENATEEDFWDFYRAGKANESYYPKLFKH